MTNIQRSVTSVSWIPSDMLSGVGRLGTTFHMAHVDQPPPDRLGADIDAAIEDLRQNDKMRFANVLRAHVEFDGERAVSYGYDGGGVIGSTTLGVGVASISFAALMLPAIQLEPEIGDGWVRFTQTVGGRTGAPLPRPVRHAPFVQYRAPIVWSTLELTIHSDGTQEGRLAGASTFPRHWIYGDDGALIGKTAVADYKEWAGKNFGERTPWGDQDEPALVSEVESALERELSRVVMAGGKKPKIVKVDEGKNLVEQGDEADDLFLLLNGVLLVEVDGEAIAELGPGAIVGERAGLESGRRTATLRAVTDCKVAKVPGDHIDPVKLTELSAGHKREEQRGGPADTDEQPVAG
jgi:hypothetical protein